MKQPTFPSNGKADRNVQAPYTRGYDSSAPSKSRVRGWLIVLVVVAAFSSSSSGQFSQSLVAQNQGSSVSHASHNMSATDGKGVSLAVNGAVTPNAVSDEMAYALFFRALASPSPRRAERLNHVLAKAGLAAADRQAAAVALNTFSKAMDTVAQQRSQSPVADSTMRALEVQALEAARQTVAQSVSSAGRALLDAHVRTQVKPRVKIFSDGAPKGVR